MGVRILFTGNAEAKRLPPDTNNSHHLLQFDKEMCLQLTYVEVAKQRLDPLEEIDDVNDISHQLDLCAEYVTEVMDHLRERGFNVMVIYQAYDPLTGMADYNYIHGGDVFALKGVLTDIFKEL